MAEYKPWWLNRTGDVAAATYSPAQPEPLYGVAMDMGTSPLLTPGAYENAVNGIATVTDDQYGEQAELTPRQQDAMDQQEQAEEPTEPPSWWQRGLQVASGATGIQGIGNVTSRPAGAAWDALSGVDEETGLNRTERKWLTAQADQDSDIGGLQGDAELLPEIRQAAVDALNTGEWSEELTKAYAKYQGDDWLNKSLEWSDENIANPYIRRPISTVNQVNIASGGFLSPHGDYETLFDAQTWRDAWERSDRAESSQSDKISPGQSVADVFATVTHGTEAVQEMHEAGFDEYGAPLNQAYYDLRQDPTYNVLSGTADFTIRWFADPLVVGGKAVGATRAITKADWTRMPPSARQRIEHIVSTPAERWDDVRSRIGKTDILGQRAIQLRNRMYDLREKIRSDPDKYDETWMVENLPAFREDYLGAGLFREAALLRREEFDMRTGRREPAARDSDNPFDDRTWELAVASMFGNGRARVELSQQKELDDLFQAATSQKLESVNSDIERLKTVAEDIASDPTLTGFQRMDRLANTQLSMADQARKAEELQGKLSQYQSFHKFQSAVVDSADSTFIRYGNMREAGRVRQATDRITSTAFRPTKNNSVSATYTRAPRAAWLKRSGAVDLSGHGSLQEQLPRYLDEMMKASNIDVLTQIAQRRRFGSWEEMRHAILNRSARARTDVERRIAMHQAEAVGVEAVAAKAGLNAEEAVRIASRIRDKRGEMYREARRQAEEAGDETLARYVYAEGDTEHLIDMPISLTQLQNYYIPADLRQLDGFLRRNDADSIRASFYGVKDFTVDGLEMFNSFWKPFVLFRLGYPARTVSEEQFRILGHTGSWSTMLNDLPRAMGTGAVNTGKRVGNFAWRHFPNKKKREGARFEIRSQVDRYSGPVRVGSRTYPGAFAVGRGDMYEALNSSGDSMARQHLNTRDSLNQIRSSKYNLHKTMEGEEGHADAWLHVLNSQVANDPLRLRLLEAGDDPDKLAKLVNDIKHDPELNAMARRMPFRSHNPERWLEEQLNELNTLVPDEAILAKLLAKEEVTIDDLRARIDDPNAASPVAIDEAALQVTFGKGKFAESINKVVTTGYKVLAEIPTDVLARNPFFNKQYKYWLARQSESLDPAYRLSEKEMAAFSRSAREFALKQTRRYLFNLSNETDLVHYMRFFSPFMGAWKESMTAWGRIFTENPEAFARLGVNGWMSMGDLWFLQMVDQDGRTEDDPLHGDLDTAVVSMPKSILKALDVAVPGDLSATADMLAKGGLVQMPVSKQTLNTTLQGDPFWIPGTGPLVQLGGSYAIGDMPELSDENAFSSFMWKYLFPTGVPDGPMEAISSTLFRRVNRQMEGMEDPVFTNSATMILKTLNYQWEANGRPPGEKPTKQQAEDMAKSVQSLYIVGAVGSPFSFALQPETQMFVDMAHQYQDEFGFEDGYKRYIEDFGEDAYMFWYSNSQNRTGVPPTSPGVKQSKKQRELLDLYPDIGLAIVGMDTRDADFNYDAYQFQRRTGSRESLPPDQAVGRAEARQGWEEWRQLSTAIDAEMVARGITDQLPSGEVVAGSIQRAGAEDLRLIKRNFREHLRSKYAGWSEDYDNVQRNGGYDVVNQFRGALESGQTPDRAEWEGVAEYLDVWEAVAAELDARGAAGGSANIEAETNADLQLIFDRVVSGIVLNNLRFADVYHRFLENHTLSNGSNGLLGS